MKLGIALVVAVGVSGVVVACGSGGGSGATATDSEAFISQFCALYAPCCGKVNKPTDGASCRALYGGLLGPKQYDSVKGSACLTELRAQSNAPDYCNDPTAQAPSCKMAFKETGGTKLPGEDCSKDGDCASSAEGSVNCASAYSGSAVTKSCQVEVEGKEGDTPCIGTRDGSTTSFTSSFSSSSDAGAPRPPARGYICDVAKGIYCSSGTKACAAVHDVGAACEAFDNHACVKTAFCDSVPKLCVARRAVGDDCSSNSQSCVVGANCDSKTKKCTQGIANGAACTTNDQCTSHLCVNGKCDQSSLGFSTVLLCGGT